MFFISINGINRLINKGLSNISLKVTIEKFDVLKTTIF